MLEYYLCCRTSVLNELRIQRSAMCGFYTNSASSTGFKQRLLPLSTQSVDRARRDTIKRNNILDVLKAIGKIFTKIFKIAFFEISECNYVSNV